MQPSLKGDASDSVRRVAGARGGALPTNGYVRSANRAISCFNKHIYRVAFSLFVGSLFALVQNAKGPCEQRW